MSWGILVATAAAGLVVYGVIRAAMAVSRKLGKAKQKVDQMEESGEARERFDQEAKNTISDNELARRLRE